MTSDQFSRSSALMLLAGFLMSCSTQSEVQIAKNTNIKLPTKCMHMAPIKDFWSLEPILIKNGKIKEAMTKAEKEEIIRQYIRRKNKQYDICLKNSKS